jgi:6-phospho-beta-glucosidase
LKLAVIGGGGVRSMFLAKSIARRSRSLGISELSFMDKDEEKLLIFGGMAKKVASLLAPELRFTLTGDPVACLDKADYLITTIRPGGDSLRVKDEKAALSLGILGQETTGAAGFSFAMRSVPALAAYCELFKKHAKPGARMFNFTNPAGLVSQSLSDMGYDFSYGICDAPSSMLHQIASFYGVSPQDVSGEVYGLNHLSFFKSITLKGKEIMNDFINDPRAYKKTELRIFEPDLIRQIGCVPNEYLYYFFYPEKAVANILKAAKTRGELIEEVNREMVKELSSMDVEKDFDSCLKVFEKWYGIRNDSYMQGETGQRREGSFKFDVFSPDDGGYAGVALKYIDTVQSGGKSSMILCVRNEGAIQGLADDDVVEVSCDISPEGHRPHKFGKPDPRRLEQIRRVKIYERLCAQAIIKQDRSLAIDGLMLHPLVNSYALAKELTGIYFEYNNTFLRQAAP